LGAEKKKAKKKVRVLRTLKGLAGQKKSGDVIVWWSAANQDSGRKALSTSHRRFGGGGKVKEGGEEAEMEMEKGGRGGLDRKSRTRKGAQED